MNDLPKLPTPPADVKYALTVPQSVMFADLSLRGSRRSVFRNVFAIDYEPSYIAIDYGGAMSWNFSPTDPFVDLVCGLGGLPKPQSVALRFIEAMGRTSRFLARTAVIVSAPARRRVHSREDLLEDLGLFWDAYENHMSTLFTFWNVETLLTEALVEALRREGHSAEIEAGLPSFIRPSEANWFSLEQQNLLRLQQRFGNTETSGGMAAASDHATQFGFLLAPFNIGEPPTPETVLQRMRTLTTAASAGEEYQALSGYSLETAWFGELERQLSFWKTERLDAFALADAYALSLYQAAATELDLPVRTIFNMTRQELSSTLTGLMVDIGSVERREDGYCLALIDGEISFYEPNRPDLNTQVDVAASGTVLRGTITSGGVVIGRVRLVKPGETPTLSDDEILVTQMTRPDMGAALDQALAYVTDEGGRLSHAAIVSREKRKPCVTAVGDATRLLRPGMLIEVNGDQGTVTVLDASFLSERP